MTERGHRLESVTAALHAVDLPPGYHQGSAGVAKWLPNRGVYHDRRSAIEHTSAYIAKAMPDLLTCPPMDVLDVGPGCGHWMEFARGAGHTVSGVDCLAVSELVRGYQSMTSALGLVVGYVGFHTVMRETLEDHDVAPSLDMIHSRASLGGVLACYYQGRTDPARVLGFLDCCCLLLRPGGHVHVSHNAWDGLNEMISTMGSHDRTRLERVDPLNTRHWLR